MRKRKGSSQKKLGTLQTDNKRLSDEAELVRGKYGRSLEMLKQYQDRLVSLSEEKESLSNISRVMQASEADAETRMVELESEVASLHDSLAEQRAIVESHVDIENKQEQHVRDLENKLSKALKKAARAAAANVTSEMKKKVPISNLAAKGMTAPEGAASEQAETVTSTTAATFQSLKRPRSPSSSAHSIHQTTLPAPIPSAEVNIPGKITNAVVGGEGGVIGGAVSGFVSATSVSPEETAIPPYPSRVAHLQQEREEQQEKQEQQPGKNRGRRDISVRNTPTSPQSY